MNAMIDYAQAGFDGRQTGALYSSSMWYAEQAGKFCRTLGIYPLECKMSKGYSVLINRDYLIKFDKNDNPTITRK